MKIYISMPEGAVTSSFIPNAVAERMERLCEVEWNKEGRQLTKEEFAARVKDADVVVTGWGNCRIDAGMLKGSRLKIVMHTGGTVGDLIDPSVYDETDVKVISGNDYYAESVAEGVLAYTLMALRRLDYHSGRLKNGIWRSGERFDSEGLLAQKVGIISLGAISKHFIRIAKPLRIDFRVYSTKHDPMLAEELGFTYQGLEDIFRECKVVSVHTAANKQTENMINKNHFKLLQDGAVFINTSRGMVINDEDLVEELKKGRFHAVLDVYRVEPLPADSPYLKLDNVTLYPHIAGPTPDRRHMITGFLLDDVISFMQGGTMKNIITKDMAARMTRMGG